MRVSVSARQGGQARDGPARHAAVLVPRQPDAHAEVARPRPAVSPREADDRVRGEPGDRRHALGRIGADMLPERLEAERRPRDVVVVEEVLPDQDVHQAEGQRPVGPRADHQVLVRLPGRPGAVRVDADDARPARPRLLDQRHQVDVGVGRVDPPEDHQLRPDHLLRVVPGHDSERGPPSRIGGRPADRPVELARAEGVEERVAGVVLDAPQRPGVGEGQDRLRAPLGDDAGEAVRDLLDRLVPRDGLELGGPLRPDRRIGRSTRSGEYTRSA